MKTYLEPGEVATVEKAASNLRDKLLIRILFRLGCQVSEALGLPVEDIDFNRGNRKHQASEKAAETFLLQLRSKPWGGPSLLPSMRR
jgi:site-specific recombinase XerD